MLRGAVAIFVGALVAVAGAAGPAAASDPPYSHAEFERPWVDVEEGNDLLVISVVREQALLATEGRVDFETEALEATENVDYEGAWGTLVFAAGQDRRSIVIRIRDDDDSEGVESFRLVLSNPRGSIGSAGSPSTVWIVDDDNTAMPTHASVGVQASERVSEQSAPQRVVRKRVTTVRRSVPRQARVAAPVEPPTVPLQIVPGPTGTVRSSPVPVLGAFAAVLLGRVLATLWLRRGLFATERVPSAPWPPDPPPLS